MPLSLSSVRDLLMPAVCTRSKDATLVIDYTTDNIWLKHANGTKNDLLLTRNEIDDNIWKDVFVSRLDELLKKESIDAS